MHAQRTFGLLKEDSRDRFGQINDPPPG